MDPKKTTYFEPRNPEKHERIERTGADEPDYCTICGREYMEHYNGRCPSN